MRLILSYYLFFFLLSACSARKQSQVKEQNNFVLKDSQSSLTRQIRVEDSSLKIQLKDSAEQEYSVQILPVGEFSFSESEGFKGQAKLVRLQGWKNLLLDRSIEQRQQKTSVIDSNTHGTHLVKKQSLNQKTNWRIRHGTRILLWLVLPMLLAGFFFFRRFRLKGFF